MVVMTYKSDSLGVTIEIDHDACDGDGECVDVCPAEVFVLENEKSTAPNIDEAGSSKRKGITWLTLYFFRR